MPRSTPTPIPAAAPGSVSPAATPPHKPLSTLSPTSSHPASTPTAPTATAPPCSATPTRRTEHRPQTPSRPCSTSPTTPALISEISTRSSFPAPPSSLPSRPRRPPLPSPSFQPPARARLRSRPPPSRSTPRPWAWPQGTQFLTFTNSTTSAIPAPTFALTGTNKADFTATLSGSACTFTLPPGASCTYSITFVPSATGARAATFTLTSGSSVFTSALSGTGNTNTDTANLSISGTQAFYSAGTTYDLQLTNSGNTPINFSSIGIGYTRANYQTFTQTNNCAPQLYSQSICTIHLTVSGVRSIGGYSSAYLTLTDDLAPGYQSYPINQYPDQGSYPNYGGWVIGTSSATSLGSSDAYSYPTSSDTTDFKFTYNSCVFAHGFEYCTYNIAFAPATIGPLSDYIAGGDYSTTLTGFGLPAAAYLKANFTSATSVPYGQTTTLGGSVTNYGSTSVTLLTPTFSGPDAAAFTISACGPIANGGCNYTYTFTPTHTGDSYATVTINDSTGTFHVIENIDLVASPSLGSISPSTLSFPNTNIGTTSSAMSATISSAYNLGITASGIGTPFAIVGSSSCASTPCTLSFTYTPNYVGAYSDLVTIKDTNGNTVGTLTLYGTGQTPPVAMAPAVTLSPASFTFGSRPVGSTSIASSGSIMNSGNVTLNLSSVALTGTNAADYILSSSCGSTLAASASCSYNISFAPTASGTRSAAITIVSNAASSPNSVTLTGTAQ